MNDLPLKSSIKTFLFADNTQGLMRGKNLKKLISDLNNELLKWSLWFRANRLGVNVSKTKYLIFHNRGKKIDTSGLNFNNNDPSSPYNPNLITPWKESKKTTTPIPTPTNSWESFSMRTLTFTTTFQTSLPNFPKPFTS